MPSPWWRPRVPPVILETIAIAIALAALVLWWFWWRPDGEMPPPVPEAEAPAETQPAPEAPEAEAPEAEEPRAEAPGPPQRQPGVRPTRPRAERQPEAVAPGAPAPAAPPIATTPARPPRRTVPAIRAFEEAIARRLGPGPGRAPQRQPVQPGQPGRPMPAVPPAAAPAPAAPPTAAAPPTPGAPPTAAAPPAPTPTPAAPPTAAAPPGAAPSPTPAAPPAPAARGRARAATLPRISAFEESVERRLHAEPLPTRPLTGTARVRLTDVAVTDRDGEPVFRAPEVVGEISLGAAARGDIVATQLTLRSPEVFIERTAGERRWNYEEALAPLLDDEAAPSGATPGGRRVLVYDATIEDGRVVMTTPGGTYRFFDVDARLPSVALSDPSAPGPRLRIARMSSGLALPGEDRQRRLTVTGARLAFPDDVLAFRIDGFGIDESLFASAEGVWDPDLPGLGLDAELQGRRVQLADVAFLLPPELPRQGVSSFRLSLEPVSGGLTLFRFQDAVVQSGTSRITGSLTIRAGGETDTELVSLDLQLDPLSIALLETFTGPLPYRGTLTGRVSGTPDALEFAVVARATTPEVSEPFTVALAGTGAFGGEDFRIERLEAEFERVPLAALRQFAPGLPFRGLVSGRITLRGPPGQTPLELDVRFDLAGGTLALEGTLDLTGPEPVYDLTGRLLAVRLQALLQPRAPPVTVTADFTLVGRGTDPRTADTRVQLEGGFAGWDTGPRDTISVRASVADGALDIEALDLVLAQATLTAEGEWSLDGPGGGAIEYRLVVASLEEFAPYIPAVSTGRTAGSLGIAGRLAGSLSRPLVEGEAAAEALVLGGWSVGSAQAEYFLRMDDPIPEVRVTAAARDLRPASGGGFEAATLAFSLADQGFALDARADRARGGAIEVVANGRVHTDGRRAALVQHFRADLDGERWILDSPTLLRWGAGQGVLIERFVVREAGGAGQIAVQGRFPPTAAGRLEIAVAALPLGDVQRLLGREPTVTGDLWLEARLRGPADAPSIDAQFRLEQGAIQDIAVAQLEGELRYAARRLTAVAFASFAEGGRLDVDVSAPAAVTLDFPPTASLRGTGALRGTITAERVPAEFLARLVPGVEEAEGMIDARVVLAGSPDRPRVDGTARLTGGAVTIPAVDQRYEEITAELALEGDRIVIRELRARSDGWATATGELIIGPNLDIVADVELSFDGFRAIGVPDREAAGFWGQLTLTGPLATPVLRGEVTVDDGNIPIPAEGPGLGAGDDPIAALPRSPVQPVAAQLEPVGPPAEPAAPPLEPAGPPAESTAPARDPAGPPLGPAGDAPIPWRDAIALERVVVHAGENLWFVAEGVRIQLAGELTLYRTGGELRVFGTLEGERGTFVLEAGPIVREFDITEARVQFFGMADPNPALNVTASRVILTAEGTEIEIFVHVTGTLESPALALSTGEGVAVPESELLSLVLFGQPSFVLGAGGIPGGALLQETFVGGLATLASIELEEAVVGDLGLPFDIFRLRPTFDPQGDLGAPTLMIGSEIADDVFVTLDAPLPGFLGTSEVAGTLWGVSLVWRIDSEWRLELAYEPIRRSLLFGAGALAPLIGPDQQFSIELLRRWTY